MTEIMRICASCRWFRAEGKRAGLCWRYPPQMAMWLSNHQPQVYSPIETRPRVQPEDMCGEWKDNRQP